MARQYKTNVVKCDISSYIHYIRGIKKVGKTTLFYDIVKEQYHDLSKGLLIAVGDEIGYQALDGLIYDEAEDWQDLMDIVDDLVENKTDNNFEIIGIDTADEIIKLAMKEVQRLHRVKTGKSVEFGACFGGYGQPRLKVQDLVDDFLAKLRKSGYGVFIIGHTKIKDVKEKNGDEYQLLTSNLNADYDAIFANKADIVSTIVVEKEIDENKHIEGTTRYIYFRSDGFVDAGGRFANIPEKVEYSARNYIDAFEQGVKGAISNDISDNEIKKRIKAEKKERDKKAKEFAESINKVSEDKNETYIDIVKAKYPNASDKVKTEVKATMKEYGFKSFNDENIPTEALEKIVNLFEE